MRRATLRQAFQVQKYYISIHALREEGDLDFYYPVFANLGISIHALREEGDSRTAFSWLSSRNFYPRPP